MTFSRKNLILVATQEANKNLVWSPTGEAVKYTKLFSKYFGNGRFPWCAAFITWCAREAGLNVPDKDPAPFGYTFALAEAWAQWAKWMGFWHINNGNYTPEAGDLVLFDWQQNKPDDVDTTWDDHIGLVLGISENGLIKTAEGNASNKTGIHYRSPNQINGYIKIPDGFEFSNVPMPDMPGVTTSEILKLGSKGLQVKKLQEILGIKPDGQFGPKTEEAVKAMQRTLHLKDDGIVGPKTAAALIKMGGEKQPDAKLVFSTENVFPLQLRLKTLILNQNKKVI